MVLVELKSGETYNGTLINCDIWMNLHLVDVNGDQFWKLAETFIKGVQIKYIRLPEDALDHAKEINRKQQQNRKIGGGNSRGRGNRRDNTFRGRGKGQGVNKQ